MKTIKISYLTLANAPTMFDARMLNTMSRQQLLDHALKMTEYAQKLEGSN